MPLTEDAKKVNLEEEPDSLVDDSEESNAINDSEENKPKRGRPRAAE